MCCGCVCTWQARDVSYRLNRQGSRAAGCCVGGAEGRLVEGLWTSMYAMQSRANGRLNGCGHAMVAMYGCAGRNAASSRILPIGENLWTLLRLPVQSSTAFDMQYLPLIRNLET